MVGISEVIQTLGAMILFSLILLTSNRMIQMNTLHEVNSEAESIAISLAQSIIEEAQTKAFDATTANGDIPQKTPEGFSSCGPGSGETRESFNDFDDYDGYSIKPDTPFGSDAFTVSVAVSYVSPGNNYSMDKGSKTVPTNFKKMVVTVQSTYLKNKNKQIQLSHLRRYYKTIN